MPLTPDRIAEINGFKSHESYVACSKIMDLKNIIITPNRDHFIKGWQECEKWSDGKCE